MHGRERDGVSDMFGSTRRRLCGCGSGSGSAVLTLLSAVSPLSGALAALLVLGVARELGIRSKPGGFTLVVPDTFCVARGACHWTHALAQQAAHMALSRMNSVYCM